MDYAHRDPIEESGSVSLYTFVQNDLVNWIDPLGLAYFAKRPLGFLPFMVNDISDISALVAVPIPLLVYDLVNDIFNIEISHEHIWFEDGKTPGNIGFRPKGLFSELDTMKGQYTKSSGYFDDDCLRTAYANIPLGNYCLVGNNCQTWADAVRKEYKRLKKEKGCKNGCKD